MKQIEENNLNEIYGGTSTYITSALVNAIVNVIKVLKDAGYSVGSSIRRISENDLCPLE
jgi:hypothetical protein